MKSKILSLFLLTIMTAILSFALVFATGFNFNEQLENIEEHLNEREEYLNHELEHLEEHLNNGPNYPDPGEHLIYVNEQANEAKENLNYSINKLQKIISDFYNYISSFF